MCDSVAIIRQYFHYEFRVIWREFLKFSDPKMIVPTEGEEEYINPESAFIEILLGNLWLLSMNFYIDRPDQSYTDT